MTDLKNRSPDPFSDPNEWFEYKTAYLNRAIIALEKRVKELEEFVSRPQRLYPEPPEKKP